MKHLGLSFRRVGALLGLALCLCLTFAAPAPVSALEQNFSSDDQIFRSTGKLLDFGAGNATTTTSTYDVFDFNFTSTAVRVCLAPGSSTVYLRLANSVTGSPSAILTSLQGDRMTAPVSASSAFISGSNVIPGDTINRALPIRSSGTSLSKDCTTYPFRTKGIVTHVVSGLATLEIWGISTNTNINPR